MTKDLTSTTPQPPVRCLVCDDEPSILDLIQRATRKFKGLHTTLATRGDEALGLLSDANVFDMVLTDVRMPGASGHAILRRVRELSPDIPVLVMSGVANVDELLDLQQEGATLFLRKPFALPELQLMLKHAKHLARQLRVARSLLQVAPMQRVVLPGLVGQSPAFLRSLVNLPMLARTDAPLLIGGETGTGKELVARAAHALSPRKDGPFVAVNCSALSDGLVDSELFGHQKGSFTGAVKDAPGLFRAAHGGTIFLDEVGDLTPAAQAKLLRVLQEREVRPVGSVTAHKVNVRVMAATHRDLPGTVRQGRFREDLMYRLCVGEVKLPPLRERPDDILLLAHTFLASCRKEFMAPAVAFAPDAVQALMEHPWPGNVRELEGTIMRAAAVCAGAAINLADLGLAPQAGGPPVVDAALGGALVPFNLAKQQAVDAFERAYVTRLLSTGAALGSAAQLAQMDRKSLYRLLKKHGLQGPAGESTSKDDGSQEP